MSVETITGYGGWWLSLGQANVPVGDDLPLPRVALIEAGAPICDQRHPELAWYCDRPENHRGRHLAAFADGTVVAVWSSEATRHGAAISTLREAAHNLRPYRPTWALRLEAVAALLECHDATGINLSTFGPVGQWVDSVLADFSLPPHIDNGA